MTKEEISKKSSSMQSDQVNNLASIDIRIDPHSEKILPPLPEPQMAELRRSIQCDGQQFPILVNSSGLIIDGANRYKICKSLGIEPIIKVVNIDGPDSRQQLAIKMNLFRRQSNSFQCIELLLALEDSYKEAAKERQLSKLRNSKNIALASSLVQNYNNEREETKEQRTEQQNGRTIDHLAKFATVSPSTFAHGKYLLEHASEQMKIRLRAGEITIDNAYRGMRKAEKDKNSGAHDRRSELSKDNVIPRSEEICAGEQWQENNLSAQNAS